MSAAPNLLVEVGFAECFSPPDPLQKRLIEAKEILENAFYEVAEVSALLGCHFFGSLPTPSNAN